MKSRELTDAACVKFYVSARLRMLKQEIGGCIDCIGSQ